MDLVKYLTFSMILFLLGIWRIFLNRKNILIMLMCGKIHSWTNLETLGNLLYTTYFFLFLVSSLILLVVVIGEIVLTLHKTTKVKRQDVFIQNAIDFHNTIRKIR